MDTTLQRARFYVAGMDCPSEEQLIRSALAGVDGIERLEVDVPEQSVVVWYRGGAGPVREALSTLSLGAELVGTEAANEAEVVDVAAVDQSRALRLVLVINAVMFAVELVAGWLAESTGLLADSLDMLADAAVYGIALWAVGRAAVFQRTAARVSGWLQLVLALGVLAEVARRAYWGSTPGPPPMMAIAALALVANVICMLTLSRHRDGGAHMKASWIFTTNDVIANLGVIIAGALVWWTGSAIPDLVVGTLIGLIVLRGAVQILRLSRPSADR
jgi:Co/Zn/Cd efflux system component